MAHPTPAPPPRRSPARVLFGAVAVVLARSRFLVLVCGLLGLIAVWPFARAYWGKLTRPDPAAGSISSDTEYWCPMCPGVVSAWPAKCPVCFMGLVRRQKADMTPLPDGALARVQLSPYRVQLAGLRTAPVEYRRLEYEAVVAGRLEADPKGSAAAPGFLLVGDVFDRDAALVSPGQEGAVACDACPGESFVGRVLEVVPGPSTRVRVRVDDPRGDLRPGAYAAATFRTPAAALPAFRRLEQERWRDALALTVAPSRTAGVLLDAAARQAAARAGLTLCVPEPAVIDTGTRRVVYVETMPGTFDATEVVVGRRCGDFYPVRAGVEPGQRVATAGAVLLDAETRLNPALAATYFGAGAKAPTPPVPSAPASPDAEDARLAARQKVCPVTKEPLDSMGGPVKLVVDGRVVFICCKGCEKAVRAKPAEYLRDLPQ
ncbi:MAG: efflux RND transporter periplasmic adaptor subunit [Gemmataceae bacterium]|nr:efflux RND transporter periplasmic adaptor subunit [Gemmataceae bacterium]